MDTRDKMIADIVRLLEASDAKTLRFVLFFLLG